MASASGGCVASFRGGPQLSPVQLADLAIGVGSSDPVAAVAHALAESGGRYQAWCRNANGTVDRGLWQFNSKWYAYVSDDEAYDPGAAAWHMAKVTNSRGWGDWVADPAPKMDTARAAVEQVRTAVAAGATVATPPRLTSDGKPRPGTWVPGTAARAENGDTGAGPVGIGPIPLPPNPLDLLDKIPNPLDLLDDVPGVGTVTGAAGTIADAGAAVGAAVARLFDPAFWRKVGLLLAAGVLFGLAVMIVFRETTGPTIARGLKATPQGAAIDAAAGSGDDLSTQFKKAGSSDD